MLCLTETAALVCAASSAAHSAVGRQDCHEFDDWFQAETDFLGTKKTAIGTQRKSTAA
jgi:hypothetical protein